MSEKKFLPSINLSCIDQRGITNAVTGFIKERGGNLDHFEQFVVRKNGGSEEKDLHARFKWKEPDGREIDPEKFKTEFKELIDLYRMKVSYDLDPRPKRVGILCSNTSHCLMDLLGRKMDGDLDIEIPYVLSNYPKHKAIVEAAGISFEYMPFDSGWSPEASHTQLEEMRVQQHDVAYTQFLRDQNTDVLAFARFMKVFTGRMLEDVEQRVINVHHGSLPGLENADPSARVFERGAKKVGATSHYVTQNVDKGPILYQLDGPISDHDDIKAIRSKNRQHEVIVFSEGIRAHVQHRIEVLGDNLRTVRYAR